MDLVIKELVPKDERLAAHFACAGMHFERYVKGKWVCELYARWFFAFEKVRSTQIIAAYAGDKLAGVLLACIQGDVPQGGTLADRLFAWVGNTLLRVLSSRLEGEYLRANQRMLSRFAARQSAQGEIGFLAVNPALKRQGVGKALLAELSRREVGRRVIVFSDAGCDAPFYERVGFSKEEEETALLHCPGGKLTLACYLYSKVL